MRELLDIMIASLNVLFNVTNQTANEASRYARTDLFKCNVFGLGTRLIKVVFAIFEITNEKISLRTIEAVASFLNCVTIDLDSSKVTMLRSDVNG